MIVLSISKKRRKNIRKLGKRKMCKFCHLPIGPHWSKETRCSQSEIVLKELIKKKLSDTQRYTAFMSEITEVYGKNQTGKIIDIQDLIGQANFIIKGEQE